MSDFVLWQRNDTLVSGEDAASKPSVFNCPNFISLVGLATSIGWLVTGNKAMGVASILADELDGPVARATCQTSSYGSQLDYAIDVAMTGAVFYKIKHPWLLLGIVPTQAFLRDQGYAPSFGSFRALGMAYGIVKGK